jgi:integrase
MRPGAIRDLEWTAINREDWTLRITHGHKRNKGRPRFLPLAGPLRAIFERAWQRRVDYARETGTLVPWVFWRRHTGRPWPGRVVGDPVRVLNYTGLWRQACRAAGCVGRVPYDLRRTALRNLWRETKDEALCMMISGHKTRHAFQRYNIVTPAELGDALDLVFARRSAPAAGGHDTLVIPFSGGKSRQAPVTRRTKTE